MRVLPSVNLLSGKTRSNLGGQRRPSFNRGKGNEHDALTSFALEFEALVSHLGDELAALTTCRAALRRVDGLASEIAHKYNSGRGEQ